MDGSEGIVVICIDAEAAPGVFDGSGIGVCDVLAAKLAREAALDTRLLNAGHPLQPACPPVPLHIPPPGHEPD